MVLQNKKKCASVIWIGMKMCIIHHWSNKFRKYCARTCLTRISSASCSGPQCGKTPKNGSVFGTFFWVNRVVFQVFRNVPANQIHVFYVRNVKITIETLKSRSETLEISVLLQKRCFRKLTHFWAFFHTVHGQHSFLGKGSMIRN